MRVEARTVQLMVRVWLALVALGLVALAGMSAEAAWRAIAEQEARAAAPIALPPVGYEAEDHFPGAALLYARLSDRPDPSAPAAPAAGVTGTTALPALPISASQAAAIVSAEPVGVVAARPFAMARVSPADRGRALQCLTAAIYYEAASEPDIGQQAVAQVVLNRVRHPAFPATVCGVVYQGSERAGCQFSFACDGAMARVPSRSGWARAMGNAAAALAGRVFAPVGLATHYHTYAVTPAWNRSLVMTDAVGAHFFHRWKGYWGTAAAFRQLYVGGEPIPGPHAPLVAPAGQLPVAAPTALIAATAPVPPRAATPLTTVQPTYTDSGSYVAAMSEPTAAGDTLPPAATVLDKWKDSGRPLR